MIWVALSISSLSLAGALIIYLRFRGHPAAFIGALGFVFFFVSSIVTLFASDLGFDLKTSSNYTTPLEIGGFIAVLFALATVPLAREGEEGRQTAVTLASLDRPKSVTVIAYLQIILAIIGLLVLIVTGVLIEFDSRLLPILGAMGVAALFQLFLGFMLLQGHNWARWLYFIVAPLSFAVVLAAGRPSPTTLVQVVFYLVAVYYLTRPRAVAYFAGTTSSLPERDDPDV